MSLFRRPHLPRISGFLVATLVLLTASAAMACPACAGRDDGGMGLFAVYAAMILTPFTATAIVIRVINRMTSRMTSLDAHLLDAHQETREAT